MEWNERYRTFLIVAFMLAGVMTFAGCPDWQTTRDSGDSGYSGGHSHH